MTLYVDSSAFVKRHSPTEDRHDECNELMAADRAWASSRITLVEAPRAIALRTGGIAALAGFDHDADETAIIDVDIGVIAHARAIALETGVKSLDAIHLATAIQFPTEELEFLTYDERQAAAARAVGLRLAR